MSSSSANRKELDTLPDDINAELALWKQLAFDMPSGQSQISNDDSTTPSSSQIPSPHFQVPHTAPPPIPAETYNHLIHALISLQGSASHAYPQVHLPTYPYPGPLPDYHRPWPPGTAPPIATADIAGPSSFYQTNPPISLPPPAASQSASSSQLTSSPAASPTTTPTAQDPEGTEDAISISEDKRRRNTVASARFRLKKKVNALNLERSVADLTGRTLELEREATDLRRENAWLKEIVLLKGRNFTALNVGSQAPTPGNRHDEDAESEPESAIKRKEKGKDRESRMED